MPSSSLVSAPVTLLSSPLITADRPSADARPLFAPAPSLSGKDAAHAAADIAPPRAPHGGEMRLDPSTVRAASKLGGLASQHQRSEYSRLKHGEQGSPIVYVPLSLQAPGHVNALLARNDAFDLVIVQRGEHHLRSSRGAAPSPTGSSEPVPTPPHGANASGKLLMAVERSRGNDEVMQVAQAGKSGASSLNEPHTPSDVFYPSQRETVKDQAKSLTPPLEPSTADPAPDAVIKMGSPEPLPPSVMGGSSTAPATPASPFSSSSSSSSSQSSTPTPPHPTLPASTTSSLPVSATTSAPLAALASHPSPSSNPTPTSDDRDRHHLSRSLPVPSPTGHPTLPALGVGLVRPGMPIPPEAPARHHGRTPQGRTLQGQSPTKPSIKTSKTHPINISLIIPPELLPLITAHLCPPAISFPLYTPETLPPILPPSLDLDLLTFLNVPTTPQQQQQLQQYPDQPRLGNLLLSSCPGKKVRLGGGGAASLRGQAGGAPQTGGRGPIDRDLKTDLLRVKAMGCGVVACCLSDDELGFLGSAWPDYQRVAKQVGLDVVRVPMPEGLHPSSPELLSARVGVLIAHYTLRGISVLAHCRGGVGRAGLLACAWVVRMGLVSMPGGVSMVGRTPQDEEEQCIKIAERVIAIVRRRRSVKAIETFEQVRFLVEYIAYLRQQQCVMDAAFNPSASNPFASRSSYSTGSASTGSSFHVARKAASLV